MCPQCDRECKYWTLDSTCEASKVSRLSVCNLFALSMVQGALIFFLLKTNHPRFSRMNVLFPYFTTSCALNAWERRLFCIRSCDITRV